MSNEYSAKLWAAKYASYLGFQKVYNFWFYSVFAGALFVFSLARLPLLNYDAVFCGGGQPGSANGECYWYGKGFYKVGMLTHLACILPAAALAVFQFVPMVRRKAMVFHRLNGWVITLLVVVSTVAALLIVRRSFGGGLDTQGGVGLLGIMTLWSLYSAIVAIKQLRIDEHRAWMLRLWFYSGSIITDRAIMILAGAVLTTMGDYYTVRPCAQIAYTSEFDVKSYAECTPFLNGSNQGVNAIVNANLGGTRTEKEAAIGMPFGMAIWLGLAIHAIGVEVYLNMTPGETERLRRVSEQKRAELSKMKAS